MCPFFNWKLKWTKINVILNSKNTLFYIRPSKHLYRVYKWLPKWFGYIDLRHKNILWKCLVFSWWTCHFLLIGIMVYVDIKFIFISVALLLWILLYKYFILCCVCTRGHSVSGLYVIFYIALWEGYKYHQQWIFADD